MTIDYKKQGDNSNTNKKKIKIQLILGLEDIKSLNQIRRYHDNIYYSYSCVVVEQDSDVDFTNSAKFRVNYDIIIENDIVTLFFWNRFYDCDFLYRLLIINN